MYISIPDPPPSVLIVRSIIYPNFQPVTGSALDLDAPFASSVSQTWIGCLCLYANELEQRNSNDSGERSSKKCHGRVMRTSVTTCPGSYNFRSS
jgi:hypothetical protein